IIGDPKGTLSGLQTFTLFYDVRGALSYYQDETEIFWNVTGHDWPGPILSARAIVNDPHNVFTPVRACYRGREGQTHSCTDISVATGSVTFLTSPLEPGEGMTIAQALDDQKVAERILERIPWYFSWLPLLLLLALYGLWQVYRSVTAYTFPRAVVAQYEPYPGVLPMYTGVVRDGHLNASDITAGLIYLAQQGFLSIAESSHTVTFFSTIPDYKLTLLREVDEASTHFHETILELLFGYGTVGETVTLSNLKDDISNQRKNRRSIMMLKNAIADDLVAQGFYEPLFRLRYVLIGVVVVLVAGHFLAGAVLAGLVAVFGPGAVSSGFLVGLGILVGLPLLLLLITYRRLTRKGREARQHIAGLQNFANGDPAFHDALRKNPQQFLEYFPYAVALGVETEWAKIFSQITIPTPAWYQTGTSEAFSVLTLSKNLSAFTTSLVGSVGEDTSANRPKQA
ncbi:MAG: DUF2207 domain-containing protein, partial [Bacteroidota bacterium]